MLTIELVSPEYRESLAIEISAERGRGIDITSEMYLADDGAVMIAVYSPTTVPGDAPPPREFNVADLLDAISRGVEKAGWQERVRPTEPK